MQFTDTEKKVLGILRFAVEFTIANFDEEVQDMASDRIGIPPEEIIFDLQAWAVDLKAQEGPQAPVVKTAKKKARHARDYALGEQDAAILLKLGVSKGFLLRWLRMMRFERKEEGDLYRSYCEGLHDTVAPKEQSNGQV